MLHGAVTVNGMCFEDESFPISFFPIFMQTNSLAPAWKKAADNLKGLVTLGAVNCDEESNRPLCGQYEIKGFPTIKIFKPGQKKPIGKTYNSHAVSRLLASQTFYLLQTIQDSAMLDLLWISCCFSSLRTYALSRAIVGRPSPKRA